MPRDLVLTPPAQHALYDGIADAGGYRSHHRLGEGLAVARPPAAAVAHQDAAPAVFVGLGGGLCLGLVLQDLVGGLTVDHLLVLAVNRTRIDAHFPLLLG